MQSPISNINIPIEQVVSPEDAIKINTSLSNILGIQSAETNISNQNISVTYNPNITSLNSIKIGIERSGYLIKPSQLTLNVSGMTCGACVNHVETAIKTLPNTLKASVNLATERASIEYLPNSNDNIKEFIAAINYAGYIGSQTKDNESEINRLNKKTEIKSLKYKLISAAVGSIFIFLSTMTIFPWSNMVHSVPYIDILFLTIATIIQFWCGYIFYDSGLRSLKALAPNMNSLICIGTSVAYFYSVFVTFANLLYPSLLSTYNLQDHLFYDTSAMIITLILLGKYMETTARVKTSQSIRQLMQLQPQTATLVQGNINVSVDINSILEGQIILIHPGESIPIDGIVKSGHTNIDESMLTGESLPQYKIPGDSVFAGTINFTGSMTIEATKTSKNTLLSKIINLVEEAQASKAPIQILADKIASFFVPTILAIGIIVFLIWLIAGPEPSFIYASTALISVLIIACPCALGLATPTAIVTGTGKAAQLGILIKNAEALEHLSNVDTIIFDKTGTLTDGYLNIEQLISFGLPDNELLTIAAEAEIPSEHPIGKAICAAAKQKSLNLQSCRDFLSIPGMGISASVQDHLILIGNSKLMAHHGISTNHESSTMLHQTVIYISIDSKLSGLLLLNNNIKPSAKKMIFELKTMNKEVVLLSGDNEEACKYVAGQLQIETCIAEALPDYKFSYIKELQNTGKRTLMIGDGINDAPALAQSDLSIAMGAGTNIAIESAQVTLLRNDLSAIISAIKLSYVTTKTIKQNLFWAFFYNILLIPIAAGILYPLFSSGTNVPNYLEFILGNYGFLNPVMAAFAMAFSSITVVANSLRLKSFK
ncbi:MAG TPA: cadmium-translocating P-type ATPase [Dehalococcoidia bacterium]|nr:cadmium-translocating P-type ATPase [Dehalococcoidia bacterium]|tara:strand:- start:3003 stop:5486 length:2484 start_codon:yes stop_codon:yes gene_type:complete